MYMTYSIFISVCIYTFSNSLHITYILIIYISVYDRLCIYIYIYMYIYIYIYKYIYIYIYAYAKGV